MHVFLNTALKSGLRLCCTTNWLQSSTLRGIYLWMQTHTQIPRYTGAVSATPPPKNTFNPLTHTHVFRYLGRLGCGEVKPGRDKVMLRHLGPVFPVSGWRHQTSWPGSTETIDFRGLNSGRDKIHVLLKTPPMVILCWINKWSAEKGKPKGIFSRKQSGMCCSCACEVHNHLTAWL